MKFIIRSGKVKGEGEYLSGRTQGCKCCFESFRSRRDAKRYDTAEEASAFAKRWEHLVRVVPLLSHEESKAKAVKKALALATAHAIHDPSEDLWLDVRMRRVFDAVGVPPAPIPVRFPLIYRFEHLMADLDHQFKRVKPLQDLIDMAKAAPNFATTRAAKGDVEFEINVKRADGRWPIEVIEELKVELEKAKADRLAYAVTLMEDLVADIAKSVQPDDFAGRGMLEALYDGIRARSTP